ncbi:MAG: hypothetical protein ACUVTQ_08565 [Desulfotomaculales bacterium]
MPQPKLLEKIVRALEEAAIPYMLTGSLVSSLQGEPRLTHDIDIVVSVPRDAVDKLLGAFPPPRYHLDEHSVRTAIKEKSMFNLIDVNEGDKVDFWILTEEPFDQSRFSRRVVTEFLGLKLYVSAPEDTILAKLRWAKLAGGSEKQVGDALRVYELQFDRLDHDYLVHWARRLGVEDLLAEIKHRAAVQSP